MQEIKRTYSFYEIHKKKLVLKPNGTPYRDKATILRLIQKYGFKKTMKSRSGAPCYALSEEDIAKLNNQIYEDAKL